MSKLAFLNFRSNVRSYLSLILSLAFTVLVFLNFQNIIFSGAFDSLGRWNRRNVDIMLQSLCIVLGCFMFFFIWYATNVFLTKRKKEIGTYVFMGLTNERIGKLYAMETAMTGISALALGIAAGSASAGLFQMILLKVSGLELDLAIHYDVRAIALTSGVYAAIYLIFVVRGYVNIVRSSVLDMISANRRNEYIRQNTLLLLGKTVLGVCVLISGYYMAVRDAGMEVFANVLSAVILVVAGTYLFFGGLIPLIVQGLAGNKIFLYRRQRTLWVNSVIFRMKKNYRTYAMSSVLILCAVTALATGFAMKGRYENIVRFRETYTFQLLTDQEDVGGKGRALLGEEEIALSSQGRILQLREETEDGNVREKALLSWTSLKGLAQAAGLEVDFPEPGRGEAADIHNLPLLSVVTASGGSVTVNGQPYELVGDSALPYLGYLQELMTFYIVSDEDYELLLPLGEELKVYSYRLRDAGSFMAAKERLSALVSSTEENYTALASLDPADEEDEWVRMICALCMFMFLVFLTASGSILFMKLYNDAFEEKERYGILRKLGIDSAALSRSAACELGVAYVLPFAVMTVSSRFSVHALEKMMRTDLTLIYGVSVGTAAVMLLIFYLLSLFAYRRQV